MRRRPIGCVLLFTLVAPARAADAPPVPEADLRAAAGKAIKLVQHSQADWDKKESCVSCHHQALPLTPFRLARERGVPLDLAAARDVTAKTFAYLKDLDEAVQETEFIDIGETAAILVAAQGVGIPPSLTTAAYALAVASRQLPDGSWRSMDNRPPQSHSPVTATAYCLQAIRLYMPAGLQAEADDRVRRAREWLLQARPAETTDRANRLLGLRWAGADDRTIAEAARQLLAEQRPDGGWAQLPRLGSDAYATGETLHVLHTAAGLPTADPAYQRGLRFLLGAQQPDGSWRIETRLHPPAPISPPYFDTKFPYARSQFSSIMGTSWAAAALLHAVPPAAAPAAPPPDVAPAGCEPWMAAALTGTAADLKKLLDAGLSPNAKTAAGTTALMMAARDAEKVKLLLDRGADPNARSATGYTAVMVAARYRGSADVVRLLLAAGADAAPKPGEKVKYDASALFFAVTTGDAATAGQLLDRGADPRRRMVLLGKLPTSPLQYAVFNDDAALATALIRRGADVNETDLLGGLTPLGWAAIGNRTAAIPALLTNGARVNHTDELGMTPLLYAASIDFGDTSAVEALLAAGADRAAKTRDGQTALDRARKYGHGAIAARLAGADGR
jgi:N-acyl-D-amino-acid deacylase